MSRVRTHVLILLPVIMKRLCRIQRVYALVAIVYGRPNAIRPAAKHGSPVSGDVETVEIHHLCPRGHKILHKLLPGVGSRINLGDSAQLGI